MGKGERGEGGGGAAKQADEARGGRAGGGAWAGARDRGGGGSAPASGEGLGAGPLLEPAPWHTGAHAPRSASLRASGGWGEKGPPTRRRVGDRSPARTRLLVLLVEFFNHLGPLPSAQTHCNLPRHLSRRAEEAAGRPAPCSGAGWAALPSLGEKARPPGSRGSSGPLGTRPRPLVYPQLVEAGPGAASGVPLRSSCSDWSVPEARPRAPCERLGGTFPERAEGNFIWLTRPGWILMLASQSLETEARVPKCLFLLNGSGIFNEPMLGPSKTEVFLPRRDSGGLLLQKRFKG